MASKKSEVYVFSHIEQTDGYRFVPSGILGLTQTDGANLQQRELASEFAYGQGRRYGHYLPPWVIVHIPHDSTDLPESV